MADLNKEFILECFETLQEKKSELLNRLIEIKTNLSSFERGGDEIDQCCQLQNEKQSLVMQHKIRNQLYEIEKALAQIEEGTYGICEETQEPIERDRLKTIPWTRLSIEGAEIREELSKFYRKQ